MPASQSDLSDYRERQRLYNLGAIRRYPDPPSWPVYGVYRDGINASPPNNIAKFSPGGVQDTGATLENPVDKIRATPQGHVFATGRSSSTIYKLTEDLSVIWSKDVQFGSGPVLDAESIAAGIGGGVYFIAWGGQNSPIRVGRVFEDGSGVDWSISDSNDSSRGIGDIRYSTPDNSIYYSNGDKIVNIDSNGGSLLGNYKIPDQHINSVNVGPYGNVIVGGSDDVHAFDADLNHKWSKSKSPIPLNTVSVGFGGVVTAYWRGELNKYSPNGELISSVDLNNIGGFSTPTPYGRTFFAYVQYISGNTYRYGFAYLPQDGSLSVFGDTTGEFTYRGVDISAIPGSPGAFPDYYTP